MGKILFIGDGYPLGTNAGSVLYQRLLKSHGINKFCYYGIGYKTDLKWPKEFEKMPRKISSLRIWPRGRIIKYFKIIPLIEELFYFLLIPLVRRKVEKFALNNNVTLIIAVFRADVLSIINKIIVHNRIPLLGFISDTVEAEYSDKPIIYKFKRNEYLKAIANSLGIYVAGESMDNYVKNIFKKETSILRLGYEPNFNTNRTINIKSKEIKVFFSGSVYAKEEFEFFLKALSLFSMKHLEYCVIITIASTYTIKSRPRKIQIINLGWVPEHELINVMQEAHIGYIPYKFDERSATQMTYAFPNKTGFYLSTGLPIFFHGPDYSSMSVFLNKYKCGIHCKSLIVEEICRDLEKIILDADFYHKCIAESKKAFNNEFSMTILKERFNILIEQAKSNVK